MEESIISGNLTESMQEKLQMAFQDPSQLSPLVLAYLGDSIYDLVIRTWLVSKGNRPVNRINREACSLVKAETQSAMMEILEPELDPAEEAVYKRGRNAKSYTSAKNASVQAYRRATGFEALMGFLYLKGRYVRMMELIRLALDAEEAGALKKGKMQNEK